MASKRFQVFISSTYLDLKFERERILRTLAECNYIAAGMEFFPAIDEEQFNFIKTVIDDSDYYVAVVGGKYGTIASDGLSYSEKEYDYAVQNGIPVIALLRENIDLLDKEKRETARDKRELLDRFRERLSTGRLISYWKDETELCYRLINSLATTTKKYPRDGWVRGGKETQEELLRKIVALEEETKILQNQLLDQKQIPLAERIIELLNKQTEIRYTYKQAQHDETPHDGLLTLDNNNIAQFLVVRLQNALPEYRFYELIGDLIQRTTGHNVLGVDIVSVKTVRSALSSLGLISVTMNGLGDIQIIRTDLGEKVIGADVIKAFELERLQARARDVTAAHVLEDLGFLLWGGLRRFVTSLSLRIKKWRSDRQPIADTVVGAKAQRDGTPS